MALLDQRDAVALLGEEVGGRDAGNAAADDDHVDAGR